jgi:hypothetical protein
VPPHTSTIAFTVVIPARPFIIDPLLFANLGTVQLETSKEDNAKGDRDRSPHNLCPVESGPQSLAEGLALLL